MCGIFAFIDKSDGNGYNEFNKTCIEKQFLKGKSRGPESTEMVQVNSVFMGFHRLAINGLDSKSNQPFFIDGVYLICNGEIYNYRHLMEEIVNQTNSDCESIIHMYKKYGIEYLFQLLDGVFSFVLYDTLIDTVYVARDPYGVRPLYSYIGNGIFAFASEIKQLRRFGINIKHVEPGTYGTITNNEIIYKRYTSFPFSKMVFNNIFDIYGMIYQKLYNAVKKRTTTTDRPIACLLSGGLDSSTIAALVKQMLPPGTVLETYSIGLEGSTDLVYAQKVADHIGSKHTSIVLTENAFFEAIPEVIKAIETYDTTTVRASVGNYLVGKYISEHSNAKVIFNGDGADELMGGYLYFHKVPSEIDFDLECKRLLSNIHYFDVLRSDRCISTHGLEPRTPFLDRSFVETYLSIPSNLRCHRSCGQMEKYLLRSAIQFIDPKLLPDEILFRTKEAFSDGVSSVERSWYKIIQEKLSFSGNKEYLINQPKTGEQYYYRDLFDKLYPNCSEILPYFWMPKYVETDDPSARTIVLK